MKLREKSRCLLKVLRVVSEAVRRGKYFFTSIRWSRCSVWAAHTRPCHWKDVLRSVSALKTLFLLLSSSPKRLGRGAYSVHTGSGSPEAGIRNARALPATRPLSYQASHVSTLDSGRVWGELCSSSSCAYGLECLPLPQGPQVLLATESWLLNLGKSA